MPSPPSTARERAAAPASFSPLPRGYARRTLWTLSIVGGVVLGVWLSGTPGGLLGKADAVGYAICHRIAARSFTAGTRQLPLCARCTGIYLGVVTGLLIVLARGRARAGRLPPVRVLIVLVVLGAAYAADGLNSYLTLFDAYTPLYQPTNTLRLLTGMTFGLALITIVQPVFNAIAWRAPAHRAPLESLRELAGLYTVAAGVCGAVLWGDVPLLRAVFGLVSAAGALLMFCVVGCVLFLTLTRRENSATRWRDLAIPALAGLIFALLVVGGIDAVRYLFTGTWDGFALPG